MKKNVIMSSATEYNNQKDALKVSAKGRKLFKQTTYTLTRLLNEMQTKAGWVACESIFVELQLPTTRKLSRNDFLAMLKADQFTDVYNKETKKSEPVPVVTTRRVVTEIVDGVRLPKVVNGENVYEYRKTPVVNGQWTIEKFIAVAKNRLS